MKLRKNTIVALILTIPMSLSLTACQDTKARQENEQLKAQLSELGKDNGDLQNHVDALTQENAEIRLEGIRPRVYATVCLNYSGLTRCWNYR